MESTRLFTAALDLHPYSRSRATKAPADLRPHAQHMNHIPESNYPAAGLAQFCAGLVGARKAPLRPLYNKRYIRASMKRWPRADLLEDMSREVATNESSTFPSSDVAELLNLSFWEKAEMSSASWWAWVASTLCDCLENLIVWTFDKETNKTTEVALSNNFAPTSEMAPISEDIITGTIPECLNGEYLLVGPNPKCRPVAGYSRMIHGLKIKDGKATYVAHYVQTSRLQQEVKFRGAKFSKLGSQLHGVQGILYQGLEKLRAYLGVLDISSGCGTGNTALVYHNNKLLALQEQDRLYIMAMLEDGDLKTMGIEDYDQKLQHPFTTHPKVDPVTVICNRRFHRNVVTSANDYFNFLLSWPLVEKWWGAGMVGTGFHLSYEIPNIAPSPRGINETVRNFNMVGEMSIIGYQLAKPHLIYRVISENGIIGDPVPITIPEIVVIHDFAITENYTLVMDLRLGLNFENAPKGETLVKFHPDKVARFGILPRYATDDSQIHWFKVPPCYIFHDFNAWDEGDEVVLATCMMLDPHLQVELLFLTEDARLDQPRLCEFRMNLKSGVVKQRLLSDLCVEVPKINNAYIGRKVPFAYCGLIDGKNQYFAEAVKYDLSLNSCENVVGEFLYGPGRGGSEAIFVPHKACTVALEDDGYLLSFVYNDNTRSI